MGPWTERWIKTFIKMGLRPDLDIVNDQIVVKPTLDAVANPTSESLKCEGK